MPPTYMTPGIPRFRLPDFSVRISPVQPKIRGMPWTMARGMNVERKPSMNLTLLFLCAAEAHAVADEKLTADDEEDNNTGQNIGEGSVE